MDGPAVLIINWSHSKRVLWRVNMRTTILLAFCLLFVSSCGKKESGSARWTGGNLPTEAPSRIVWYKMGQAGWQAYKVINKTDEMRRVIWGIMEVESENCSYGGDQKLCIFYDDKDKKSQRVFEVFFRLTGSRFEGPLGHSEALGKYLLGLPEPEPSS
jgi:hypothetical protein